MDVQYTVPRSGIGDRMSFANVLLILIVSGVMFLSHRGGSCDRQPLHIPVIVRSMGHDMY
jgi:hypothetical protein